MPDSSFTSSDEDEEDEAYSAGLGSSSSRKRSAANLSSPSPIIGGGSISFVSATTTTTTEDDPADIAMHEGNVSEKACKQPAWEKHTKGIGFALLQKMGFKGRLGKDETGASEPVRVERRPDGVGLGFGRQREKEAPKPPVLKKRKRFYANVKQMRKAIEEKEEDPTRNVALEPRELRIARHLLEDIEAMISQSEKVLSDARSSYSAEEERGEALREELLRCSEDVEGSRKRRKELVEFRLVLRERLNPTGDWLESLESLYPHAWALCGLSADALEYSGVADTLRKRIVQEWNPVEDPFLPVTMHNEWQRFSSWPRLALELFENKSFETLRVAINLDLCESLSACGVLDSSQSLADMLTQRTIAGIREFWAPRLARLLDKVKTTSSTVVLDAVAAYLKKHIRDFELLRLWKGTLKRHHWNQLVSKELPKVLLLGTYTNAQSGAIRSVACALGAPDSVVSALVLTSASKLWIHVVKPSLRNKKLCQAAVAYVDWRQALLASAPTEDDALPPLGPTGRQSAIDAANVMLDAIGLSLDNLDAFRNAPDPPLLSSLDYATHLVHSTTQKAKKSPPRRLDDPKEDNKPAWHASFTSDGSVVFADIVERFAAEHDVVFVPKHGRFHDGKQLYNFAGHTIYIESNVTFVFHHRENAWLPKSLEDLLLFHSSV